MGNKRRPEKKIKGGADSVKNFKINEKIDYPMIRIVGENESIVCSLNEGLEKANDLGMDLVLVTENQNPPICRIIDFSKFLYEQKKKSEEKNVKNSLSVVKEIKLESYIGEHDLEFKARHAINFLQKGFSVKVTMMFFGRAVNFKEIGKKTLNTFIEKISEDGVKDSEPKEEAKKIYVIIRPKKKKI